MVIPILVADEPSTADRMAAATTSLPKTTLTTQINPCLTPTPADNSTTPIPHSATNASITGNVVPPVKAGLASFKQRLNQTYLLRMELVFKLRNADQFQSCLQSISDPNSPNYGKFLNSTTLLPYLPTRGQRASLTEHLAKGGFKVAPGASPLVLQLMGSVSIVERNLGIRMGLYRRNATTSFYSADSDPKLPQSLASLVAGIQGLDNYTTTKPTVSCAGPYCPQGLQVGYAFSGLYTGGYDGTGQKVAIVDAPGDQQIQNSINVYNSQFGLTPITLDIRYPDGTPTSWNSGWGLETALDVEAVHSVAPGAGIILLYPDPLRLMNAIDYVATNHLATIVSNSWTYCTGTCSTAASDIQLSQALVSSVDLRLQVDAAQGLTILFASGDSGWKPDGTTIGTEFPSSDPNVLAIGGTNLALSGCGPTTCSGYSSENGWSESGGGYSGVFPEPSWQTSTIGTKSGRAVPDVSMIGGSPGINVYFTQSSWIGVTGTSLSTPLWAGFLSIVLQIRGGSSMGNIGPKLYQIASSTSYASSFHDITSGTNGYSAGSGWDPVTGWGTPIANNLAYALANVPTATVTSNPTGSGYVVVDGSSVTTPQAFTWYPGSTHTLAANSPVPCGSGCQYVYTSWSDGGTQTHTITVPPSYTTYTANFQQQFMLTTSVGSGSGSVTVLTGWQNAGTSVPVSETPSSGYTFYYWSLDGVNVGSSTTYSVLMNTAQTLIAYFRGSSSMTLDPPTPSIALGSSVSLQGTLSPTQPTPGIPGGATVLLSYSLDGVTYSTFLSTLTATGGTYSAVWYPPYPGTYLLRANWGGDQNYVGSMSVTRTLTVSGSVAPQPQLLIAGPSSITRGSTASYDVFVTNPGTSTLPTTVYVEIIGPNGYYYSDWLQVSVGSGSNGRYHFDWQVPSNIATGTYTVTIGLIPPETASISQIQVLVT